MKLPSALPYKIPVVNTGYWVPVLEALNLLRMNRARQVYIDAQFLGIELGRFAPIPTAHDSTPWPPIEVSGCRFIAPQGSKPSHERTVTPYADVLC